MIDQAYALVRRGAAVEAVRLLEQQGAGEDGAGFLELAVWLLEGQVVRRDLALARKWFGRAAEAGNMVGASVHLAFLAIGVGGDRDWKQALRLLDELAPRHAPAREQQNLLAAMPLDDQGDALTKAQGHELSVSPRIMAFYDLLSDAECDHLIALAEPLLQPSAIVDPATGRMRPDPVRTSAATTLAWVDENPVVHALNRRIAAASGTKVEAGEPLQILRYEGGQQYRPHHDALSGVSNQRVATMLVYLNAGYGGGETHFPAGDLKFKGRKGDALYFWNVLPDGSADPAALHSGLPVTAGRKFLATRWIRQHCFMPMR